jgi:hypothetical protein
MRMRGAGVLVASEGAQRDALVVWLRARVPNDPRLSIPAPR